MNEWPDKLLMEYEDTRKKLRQALQALGDSERDSIDRELLNGMINDMTFAMDWMRTGREPDTYRGADRRNIYQERYIADMDVFKMPLDIGTQRVLTDDERVLMIRELAKLSPRERQCFIMAKAFMWTQADVAAELGISQPAVNQYLKSAEKKISAHGE